MSDKSKMPYKGLNPYSETDEPLFFGRENDRESIIDNLEVRRWTILYGKSGVGKSSVLRAGVAHKLRQKTANNLHKYQMPQSIVVVFPTDSFALQADDNLNQNYFCWQDEPIAALKHQIEKDIKKTLPNIKSPKPDLSFVETVQAWTEGFEGQVGCGELLIILDQFEEYFLYHPQEDGTESFAVEFPRAVNRANLRINFLVSIREDSLAKLDRFKGRIPKLFDNYLRIEHLDEKSAHDAIVKPIEEYYNQLVLPEKSVSIEKPALVEEILKQIIQSQDELKGGNGRGGIDKSKTQPQKRIEAPYLQLVITRLWQREMELGSHCLRLKTLTDDLGGVEAIVREHLNARMRSLTKSEQDIASSIFQYLVTPSGTKITYPVLELAEPARVDPKQLATLLEKLAGRNQRIVRAVGLLPDQAPEAQRYEIFHDVLAQPVLDWRRQYLQQKKLEEERQSQQQELEEERQQRILAIKRSLPGQSLRQQRWRQDELAALLALQAYRFNQQDQLHVVNQVDDLLRQIDDALRTVLSASNFSNILQCPSGIVSVAFSPDGQAVAASSPDGGIRLWNWLRHPNLMVLTEHKGGVFSITFSPDGQMLASGGDDHTIRLWDLSQDDVTSQVLGFHNHKVTSVAFSPDGKTLASGSYDQTIKLWNPHQPNTDSIVLRGHTESVKSVAFSPDGKILASGGDDRTIRLWNLQQPDPDIEPTVRYGHEKKVRSVAFSLDGQILASASDDRTIRIWDLTDANAIPKVLEGHKERVRKVAFSPDGKILASAGDDQTIRLWDTHQLDAAPKILKGHYFDINSMVFSPNSQMLISGSWDNTVRLWDLRTPSATPKVLEDHKENVMAVAFSPDGKMLASGSLDKTVLLWNLRQLDAAPKVFKHGGQVFGVAFFFSKDRRIQMLASGCEDQKVRLWYLHQPDADPRLLSGHQNGVSSVAFSPDGQLLASGSWDKTVRLWNLQQRDIDPLVFLGHEASVTSVAFSRDGKILASGSDDNTIRLWKWHQCDADPIVLKGHIGRVRSVAFSPDGQMLASASDDWTVRLWNLQQPDTEPRVLKGHNTWVGSVAFSPDGKTLASGSYDRSIRMWNLNQLDQLPIVLEDHDQSVTSVAFSPDGKWLASGSYDNTVRLWIAGTDILAEMVGEKVLRHLTQEEWQRFLGNDIPYDPG